MTKVPSAKELKEKFNKPDRMRGLLHDFYRELSFYAAIPFLYASVTANQVTLLSMVFGLVAAFYYSVGTFWGYIIATLFFAIFTLLDHVDGLVARYKINMGKYTYKGEFLEAFSHAIINSALDIGLILGIYQMTQANIVLIIGSIMFLIRVLIKYESYSNYRTLIMTKTTLHYNPDTIISLKGLSKFVYDSLFTTMYINYTILFFVMLDFFIQKIPIYPFSLSYLMVFIVIQIIARTLKLCIALHFHLVKSQL